VRPEKFGAAINLRTKRRFSPVHLPGHIDVLRPLAGKHKKERSLLGLTNSRKNSLRIPPFQCTSDIVNIEAGTHKRAPMPEGFSANLVAVGHICEVNSRMLCKIVNETVGRGL